MSSIQRLSGQVIDESISQPIESAGAERLDASGAVSIVSMIGGVAWGLALGVVGLWVLMGSSLPGFLGSMTGVQRAGVGLGMLCGGQLIFLVLVAGRMFPGAPRQMMSLVHWGLFGVGGVCLLVVCYTMIQSGGAS